jgi:hypothetical protein
MRIIALTVSDNNQLISITNRNTNVQVDWFNFDEAKPHTTRNYLISQKQKEKDESEQKFLGDMAFISKSVGVSVLTVFRLIYIGDLK